MSGRYGSDGRLQIDAPAASIINVFGNSGILAVSAGTEMATTGTVVFADSNGVTWGMSSNTITASMAGGGGGGTGVAISAGTQSVSTGTVAFVNSNNFTFGMSGSNQITGSYTAPVVSNAIQSVGSNNGSGTNTSRFAADDHMHAGVFSVGVSSAGNTLGDTRVDVGRFVFQGGNNITLSQITAAGALNTIVVSGANAGGAQTGISGIQVSDAIYTSGTVTFQNANGASFGASGANGISISYTVPTQSNQTAGIYGTSNTTGQSFSSTYDARSLTVEGAGIVSVGWSNSSFIVSATQSNQALSGSNGSFTFQTATFGTENGFSFLTSNGSMVGSYTVPTVTNSSWTASDSATSLTIGQLAFSQSNGLALSLSTTTGGKATVVGSYTVPSTAGLISAINISAGLSSSNVSAVTFSNSNNVSFGYNGTAITASASAPQWNRIQAGAVAASLGVAVNFTSANNITFGLDAGAQHSVMTASYEFDVSAGTASSGINAITFADSNGIKFGFDNSNITANAGYLSYYENLPWIVATGTMTHGNSTVGVVPFNMPLPGSFSYIRIPHSFSSNSTSQTATTNSSFGFSGSILSTLFAVVYSLGTGANSRSLQSVASGSAGFSHQLSFSASSGVAGSGTRWSYTHRITYPQEGATNNTFSYTTAQSSGVFGINTETIGSPLSDFNSFKHLDIPFANSLSAGAYWLAIGRSSTTSTQSLAFLTGAHIDQSNICVTQGNQPWGLLGSGSSSSNQIQLGIGSYTTNAMTTGSIALSQISSSISHMHPYFQLHRQA